MNRSVVCALAAVLMWSTIATAFSLGLREMDGLQLMFGASLVSILSLLLLSVFQGTLGRFKTIGAVDIKRSALLGLLNPFAYYAVLLKAYSMLPAQEAMVLNYLWPVALVVLSVPLLGQHVSKTEWAALTAGFLGILVVATQGKLASLRFTHPLGDALAIGSALLWGAYWNLNVRFGGDGIVRLVLNLAFGSVYLLLAVLLFSKLEIPTARGAAAILYVGLFEMGITFFLWLMALRLAPSTARIGQLVYLAPFLSLFWIRLALGEKIHPATMIGLALVVGGALVQQYLAQYPAVRRLS
jgi:drug/metabolite transporter (DMT)-like permease